jgi:CarD family transcriptional regulator
MNASSPDASATMMPEDATASETPIAPALAEKTPKPLGKAEHFAEGDYVVYPTHGVGKVERIATEEIAGHKLELIHITFEENRMTLRVPVAKARTAGLRKLATRKLFDDALAVLKGRARVKRTMWSRRAQEYEAKINSGDPLAIAEVVRDLHRNSGQPDQSFSERQIYEAAMDRLAAELAALDRTDKVTAAQKLNDFLKTL